MCYHPMQIWSVSEYGSMKQYVPCGHCEECRNVQRFGWSFRLQSELQYRASLGWKSGFVTLTYAPDFLPKVNPDIFEDASSDVPCFDRQSVRDFICAIRKYLHRHYGVTQLVYMVCSEYGKRGRPHYHMLLSWPPAKCLDKSDLGNSEYLDDVTMHRLIRDTWRKGFIFPQYPQGGFDGVYYHKPFQLTDVVSAAAKYASKYCCKDINFAHALSHCAMIPEEAMTEELEAALKNSMPFHIQSKSLGWSLVAQMSDSQKLDLIENGFCFVGQSAFQQIPLYIRNKVYFNPVYIIDKETGKRLVRRERSQFFYDNKEIIFERKVDFYADLLQRLQTSDYWLARGLSEDKALKFSRDIRSRVEVSQKTLRTLSEEYVAWFGVWPLSAYDVPPIDQWFSRFSDYWFEVDVETGEVLHDNGLSVANDYDPFFKASMQMPPERLAQINDFWSFVFDTLMFTNHWLQYDSEAADVEDYWRKYLEEQGDYRVFSTVDRVLRAS